MEYLAKITYEQKLENIPLWKYTFLDTQTNQQDYFYNRKQIDYDPNLTGELSISSDKFFQSFKKKVGEIVDKVQKAETLIKLKGETKKAIDKAFGKISKKQINLSPQKLHELHARGYKWKEISDIYGKSEATIYRWLKPNNKPSQKRGRKTKANKEAISLLRSYVDENSTITQQDMINFLAQKVGLTIHQSNISRLLKREKISHKKLTYHYNQLDEARAKKFNEEIKPLLTEYPFIAIDECSFYANSDPRFGYSLKGTRARAKKPSSQGKHYTLLFAIGNYDVIHWELVESKVNWKVFYDFSEKIKPIGDKKNILLIDNARIHTAFIKRKEAGLPTFKEQMAKKNIEVRYITPYAPMLNVAEYCFNLLRQQTEKQKPRSYKEMREAIEKVVELLNTKDLSKYFWHCANYFDKKESKIELKYYH